MAWPFILALALALIGFAFEPANGQPAPDTPRVEIGDGWGRPQYESSADFSARLAARKYGPIVAFLVVRDGRVVFEQYEPSPEAPDIQVHRNTPLKVEAARLPLISTVVGAAFLHGDLISTEAVAPGANGNGDVRIQELKEALEHNTGEDLTAYAGRVLFEPLGIRNYSWGNVAIRDASGLGEASGLEEASGLGNASGLEEASGLGNASGLGGPSDLGDPSELRMTARDLAKIGQLYVDGGVWQNQLVIPDWWPLEAFRPRDLSHHEWRQGFDWQIRGQSPDRVAVSATSATVLWMIFPDHHLVGVVVAADKVEADGILEYVLAFKGTRLRN